MFHWVWGIKVEPHSPWLITGTSEDHSVISALVPNIRSLVRDMLAFSLLLPQKEKKLEVITLEVITETRQERKTTYVVRCAEPWGW